MPVKLVSSGGGSVTLNAPSTGSDFTANVPARDGTLVGADSSGNLRFNSGYGSEAVAYGCRAWGTVRMAATIRAHGNVSSVADIGASYPTQYLRINLLNAMPDANYCVVTGHGGFNRNYNGYEAIGDSDGGTGKKGAGFFEIDIQGVGGLSDEIDFMFAIFR